MNTHDAVLSPWLQSTARERIRTTCASGTAATGDGSGTPSQAADEAKSQAGNSAKGGPGSTPMDGAAAVVALLNFETPAVELGKTGGIPGGHCNGAQCLSGPVIQGAWIGAVMFGSKAVTKAVGLWSAAKAAVSHAGTVVSKVVDRAATRISKLAARGTEPAAQAWKLGAFKSAAKWEGQLAKRSWTPQQITEAIQKGEKFGAENLVNKGNAATRYVHPETGLSVVLDEVTKEVIHVGGPGFRY